MNENNVTLIVLMTLILCSMVWAYFTPIDTFTEASGIARSDGAIPVAAEISGKVAHIYRHEGQMIHAGDALVQLDTRQIDLKLHLLQAKIHAAEIRIQRRRDEQTHIDLLTLYQQLEQAEVERSRLTILSPADGIVSIVSGIRPGETLVAGSGVASIIRSDRDLIVESWIDDSDRTSVHTGQRVRLQAAELSSDVGSTFDGIVQEVQPQIVDSMGKYRVLIAPRDNFPLVHSGKAFRVHFPDHQTRLLRLLVDRLKEKVFGVGKTTQPGRKTPVGRVNDYGVLADAVGGGTVEVGIILIAGMFAPT